MFVGTQNMYDIKRFLYKNKGMVIPFSKIGEHSVLKINNFLIHKALKTLHSKNYLEKIGNWQHAWYFLTEEGDKKLKEEVGLPNEKLEEEREEIKN